MSPSRSRSRSRHRPPVIHTGSAALAAAASVAGSADSRSPSPPSHYTVMTSRGRPVSQYMPARPRSRSRSTSRSASSSRGTRRSHSHSHHEHRSRHEHRRERRDSSSTTTSSHHHHHGLMKTSAGLLAGLGVAAVVAHKVWPNILHEEDERESRDGHRHHSHDHHHGHSHRSEHRHHGHHGDHRDRRPSDTAERMIHRPHSMRGDGDVFYEEAAPVRHNGHQGRPVETRGAERSPRLERPRLEDRGRVASLPYPERPYPSEVFYEPELMRTAPAMAR